jgi:hypothetical protein
VAAMEHLPDRSSLMTTNLNATAWINENFYWKYLLKWPPISEKPFDGLDKMLLLSWVRKQFAGSINQSFVLDYFDLRSSNIIIDNNDNMIGIIDWDDVGAVPLKLSAVSIAESFFPQGFEILGCKLDGNLDDLFQRELRRIEQEKSSSTEWSQMFLHSRENLFLFEILLTNRSFLELREIYPDLLAQALCRSSENLALVASEWRAFASRFYLDRNHTIPDYPDFVEIQESLGIYGRSRLERWVRKLRRNGLRQWNIFIDKHWSIH